MSSGAIWRRARSYVLAGLAAFVLAAIGSAVIWSGREQPAVTASPPAATQPAPAGATTVAQPADTPPALATRQPEEAAETAPTASPPPQPREASSSVFGVEMIAVTDDRGRGQAVQAGAKWVRPFRFIWDAIEPERTTPPTYRWGAVNEASLVNAADSGLTVIGVVHFAPPWAQAQAGVRCGPIRQDALEGFAQFLAALAERYRRPPYNVHYWELWNEPDTVAAADHGLFGCWGDPGDDYFGGGYYAEMLKLAYPALKAADPQAEVLVGGLLLDCDPRDPPRGKDCKSSRFLEGILRSGGGAYFDEVAFHAFTYGTTDVLGTMGNANWPGSGTTIPQKAAFLRGVLQQYGWDKPLMATEVALLCAAPSSECLETQAMYVPRAYAEALALGLRSQVYYQLVDGGWYNEGLLSSDLTAKPAYRAFTAASSFLGAARFSGPVTDYPAGIVGYAFDRPGSGDTVDVIWSANGSAVAVPLPAEARAVDRYGALVAESGTIQVDYSPVYLVGP